MQYSSKVSTRRTTTPTTTKQDLVKIGIYIILKRIKRTLHLLLNQVFDIELDM
jgi:hypothetical protein